MLAYYKNQLQNGILRDREGKAKYTSADRYHAGVEFKRIWLALAPSGKDSTDIDRVDGNGGGTISAAQANAIGLYGRVAGLLNKQDREIVQHVCAEEWWPSRAVQHSCGPGYVDATVPRLNEALDNLIEALGRAKRCNPPEPSAI